MFKYLLSASVLLFATLFVQSQTTITIGTGTALTADGQSGPIYRSSSTSAFDYSQFAYLYTASELSTIASGSVINKIAWNKTNSGATVSGGKFKIYFKNSTATGYTTATAFSTLISGATLVYDNSSTNIPASTGFLEFAFSSPFTYTGNGLEIMVDWDISAVAGNPTTADFSWQKTTVESKILGYANSAIITTPLSPTNNSIGDITNTRPVVQLTFGPALPACTGTPAGGEIAGADSVCSGVNFTLSVNGSTTGVAGLSYQWQSSGDSISWINIGSTTNETINVSETSSQYYRRIISCGANADTSTSKIIRVKSASNCICLPSSSDCTVADVITNVSFGTLNNSSDCSVNGYTDYSESVAAPVLTEFTQQNISVTVGNGGTEYVAAWIDFNHDGIFETDEYTFIGSGTGTTVSNTINIPDNIPAGLTKLRVRLRYNSTLSATDYCSTVTYGETEDYLVNIQAAPPCSGTPVGGTAVSSSASACPGDSVVITVNNSTTGFSNIYFQWELSHDNLTWTNIVAQTGSSYTVHQNVPTWYRRRIFCGGGSSAYSTSVYIDITASNLCYCKPDSSNCSVTAQITNVNFASLNNNSNCSYHGYGNYAGSLPITPVQAGVTVPISISSYSVSSSLTNFFIVWIDYDHSGTFDSSEATFIGSVQGTGTITGSIAIPANALTGNTGMRVRAKFNSPPITATDACTAFGSSETEDYLLNILPASSCTNGLTAGIISGPYDVCTGFNFDLASVNTTNDPTVRYAWQSSTDSINWTNINNTAGLLDHISIFQTAVTFYRLVDSCSSASAISNVIKVRLRSGTFNCHCIPPGSSVCTIGDIIARVIFGTIDNSTYCSLTGYDDYTTSGQTTTISANSFASISVQVGCASLAEQYVAAWIDFNQNGVFERSEFTLIGPGCGTTITSFISVPTNALSGQARMRVRVTADTTFTPSDACTHFPGGETEDYKINISPYSCPVNTWTGSQSNSWENPLNWSCGEVPGVHSNVVINSGNVVINSNVTVYSLDVNAAATVTVNPPYNLVITE